jgi:hypothetical protein
MENKKLGMQKFSFSEFLGRYNPSPEKTHSLFSLLDELKAIKNMLGNGVWIAGGAIRKTILGEALNTDVDFFFGSSEILEKFKAEIIDYGAELQHKTDHQETYVYNSSALEGEVKLQLVKIDYYKDVESLLNSFDFTICQFAYDGENLYCGKYSLWDLSRKRLAIHKITYAIPSMRRIIKYSKQGFYACSGFLADFLTSIASEPSLIDEEILYID